MPDGTAVTTEAGFSSLGNGSGVPADAQEISVADERVVLANGSQGVNGDGRAVSTVAGRTLIGDGRVVLTDG